jgi:hypothetical protein
MRQDSLETWMLRLTAAIFNALRVPRIGFRYQYATGIDMLVERNNRKREAPFISCLSIPLPDSRSQPSQRKASSSLQFQTCFA